MLDNTISKLPNFRGIVYRKVYLTNAEIDKYANAFQTQSDIIEYPFISTSKSISVGVLWGRTTAFSPNCLFVIYVKTGKAIELMSKFVNEKEVILRPNTRFNVLDILQEPAFIQITMEEV